MGSFLPLRGLHAASLVALGLLVAPALAADPPAALTRLGAQAIESFDRQLDPPPIRITIADWPEREAGVLERAQLHRLYAAAVQALMALAADAGADADRLFALRAALDDLARNGSSSAADRLFAQQAEAAQARGDTGRREAAQAWRHSVALSELPVALATRGGRPDARGVLRGHSQLPLGTLALPGLQRAAALDNSDAWTWILIAALQGDDAALPAALRSAMADADDTTALAAAQQLAALMLRQERVNDAAQVHAAAVARAEQTFARDPGRATAPQLLAFALHRRAEFEGRQGHTEPARDALQRALRLRAELVAADPDDTRRQWDLIATHSALASLPVVGGENHLSQALALVTALNERDRFVPMFDSTAAAGMSNLAIRVGGSLTLMVGFVLLALYRVRVGRWMRAAAAACTLAVPARPGAPAPDPQMAPSLVPLADAGADPAWRSRALAAASAALRRAGVVQFLAGLAFALTAAVLSYRLGNLIFRPWAFAIVVWSWLMPVTIMLCMLWTGDRRRQAAVVATYLAGVALFCVRIAWSPTPPLVVDIGTMLPLPVNLLLAAVPGPQAWPDTLLQLPGWNQPLVLFWLHSYQLLPALLFLSRHVRAAGPVLLTLLIVLCSGGVLASIASSTWAGMQLQVQLLLALGLPRSALPPLVFLAGALAAAPLAWLAGRCLAAAHRAKWLNDQSLVFDTIWLFQTLFLVADLVGVGGLAGLLGIAAFVAYKAVGLLGIVGAARRARARPPARLLLLRVFGHRLRSERLLDVLAARWRYAGPILMIGAPDVATRTVDPDEFMDFLSGRLRRQFAIEPQDLARRLDGIDQEPDADGRFRINELFCGNDTWLTAVRALMARSDLCLMDLRGFSQRNSGCIVELQALLDLVPARDIVLLVDHSTDQALLEHTLRDCQARLQPGSVNAGGPVRLATLQAHGSDLDAVQRILRSADAVLVAAPNAAPSR